MPQMHYLKLNKMIKLLCYRTFFKNIVPFINYNWNSLDVLKWFFYFGSDFYFMMHLDTAATQLCSTSLGLDKNNSAM